MLRIVFVVRKDLVKNPAGDTIQIQKTQEYLKKMGLKVDLTCSPYQNGKVQLFHFFNINRARDLWPSFSSLLRSQTPLVLSPIYWNMEEYLMNERPKELAIWRKGILLRQKLVERAHLLLPNGFLELKMLIQDLGSRKMKDRAVVIPNGVDPLFYEASPGPFIKRYGIQDFILSVGRISRRKNQWGLIQAMEGLPYPLVIIGQVNDPPYYRQCKNQAKKTLFLPHLSQELLASAYAAARVHVLCSWYDTPGLVSLEAALAHCNIVTTMKGTAQEYFQDEAWYCHPGDGNSIRKAIIQAFQSPIQDHLSHRILKNYTWEVVAQKTVIAYQRLL